MSLSMRLALINTDFETVSFGINYHVKYRENMYIKTWFLELFKKR